MRRRSAPLLVLVVALAALTGSVTGATSAAFTSTAANQGNTFSAAPDFRAPSIAAQAIGKASGGTTGYIRQGSAYYVYASVTDPGNPSSGISSVTANVNYVTTGQTSVTMNPGSFTAGGVSYNYRSGSVTANAGLSAGVKTFSVTADDTAGNGPTTSNGSVTVDNTGPSATDIQTANGGSTVGKPERNDRVVFTFSAAMEPNSILAGWDGTSTSVIAVIIDGGGSNDTLRVYLDEASALANQPLALGSVNLGRRDYTAASVGFGVVGGAGTASTMTMSGSAVTIVFGTLVGSTTTAGGNGTMAWTPSALATDQAGNACSTTTRNETGGGDREF